MIVFIAQSQIGNVDRRCFLMLTFPHNLFNFSCFCWFHLWLRWIRSGKFIIYITLTLLRLQFWFLSIRIEKLIKCTDLKLIYALTEFCYLFYYYWLFEFYDSDTFVVIAGEFMVGEVQETNRCQIGLFTCHCKSLYSC